jgi:hypothetical protein
MNNDAITPNHKLYTNSYYLNGSEIVHGYSYK